MDNKQVELNRRNINALVETMQAHGKRVDNLEKQIQVQAQALTTLGNQLKASQLAMANAALTMGTGPTER
ncbi:MAG: hypothetical protein ACTSUU_06825 [Candidatus Thorarchaeota archaeon]